MNNFVVPPSPNWYSEQILACAPDNTLVYGSQNNIITIHSTSAEGPLQIHFFDKAHNQKILSVDINVEWGTPNKWAVSSGEDNNVKLWDMAKFCKISSHEAHKEQKDKIIGARFLTEDRILSVSENGTMFIWHPSTKNYTKLNNIFTFKVNITCFSPCPHASYITAFGLKNGLIVIANLKKNGTLMYKLRGHTTDIVSLSWCPAPVNVFPSKPNNYIKGTNNLKEQKFNDDQNDQSNQVLDESSNSKSPCTLKPVVIENSKAELQESSTDPNDVGPRKAKKENPWVNLKFEDDDEIQEEEASSREIAVVHDFLEECEFLKKTIEKMAAECSDSLNIKYSTNIEENDTVKITEAKDECIQNTLVKNEGSNSELSVQKNEYSDITEKVDEGSSIVTSEDIYINDDKKKCISQEKIEKCTYLNYSDNFKECITEFADISFVECNDGKLPLEKSVKESQSETLSCYNDPSFTKTEGELLNKTQNCSIDQLGDKKVSKTKPDCTEEEASTGELDTSEQQSKDNGSETMKPMSVEEEPQKEFLLASSGKDSTIYIWRAGTDGRMQCFFKLPEKKVYQNRFKKGKDVTWTLVKWIAPFSLLTATKKGELLKYTLPKPLDSKNQYTMIHNDHTSLIFAIAANVPILTMENWLSEVRSTIWTFGYDMYLLNTNLNSKIDHSTSIETFCAFINCMTQSPLDPSRVAMGLSNGTVKIWNVTDFHINHFSTVNFSPKIYSKITFLAWHPTNELILAFSTEEGTIGLLNMNNLQKATWFKQSFSVTVHKIQWAPHFQNAKKLALYAIGGGELLCLDPEDPMKDATKIQLPEDTIAFTFAWKLDTSLMLVVSASGKVVMFNSDMTVRATYYQRKKVSCVTWHPDSECRSEESTDKSYWVAAALDNLVYIYDFAEVTNKNGTLDIQNVSKTILKGHEGNVRSLSWSPFNGDRLVTAGEDGIAHVWKVSSKEILASYYSQTFEPLKCVIWSPINEDSLICSAAKVSLVKWKMSEYPAPLNEEILKTCRHRLKNEKKTTMLSKEDDTTLKTTRKAKRHAKSAILPNLSVVKDDNVQGKVKFLRELLEWKEGNGDVTSNGVPNIKQLFGAKEDVLKVLNFSELSHVKEGNYEAAAILSFWKGDLHTTIQETINQRKVTPLLISLAPTISMSLWQKACESYAMQLEEQDDSDPVEVATYYMACQNIEKAINCLCERQMFKEAFALVKCRLPENNIFAEDILQKWANYSAYCGSLEIAAQCFIVLGQYEGAVKALFRRNDIEILNFALHLAKKTNNKELEKAVEFRCKAFSESKNTEDLEVGQSINEKSILQGTPDTTNEGEVTKDSKGEGNIGLCDKNELDEMKVHPESLEKIASEYVKVESKLNEENEKGTKVEPQNPEEEDSCVVQICLNGRKLTNEELV